jgi:hypothetical protein
MFSAMIMLIYQTESPQKAVVDSAQRSLALITDCLEEISSVYATAQKIVKLSQFMSTDRKIRDKIVRSAKRYAGIPVVQGNKAMTGVSEDATMVRLPQKRGHEDDGSGAGLSPTPPVSYVRSTPQQHRAGAGSGSSSLTPDQQQRHQSNGNNNNNNHSGVQSLMPDQLTLVTNTSPTNHTFAENFRPSQLFPEPHDYYLRNSRPQSTTSDHTEGTVNSDSLFAIHDSFGDVFQDNDRFHSSDDSTSGVPNNLNVGDWYQYLLSSGTALNNFDPHRRDSVSDSGGHAGEGNES